MALKEKTLKNALQIKRCLNDMVCLNDALIQNYLESKKISRSMRWAAWLVGVEAYIHCGLILANLTTLFHLFFSDFTNSANCSGFFPPVSDPVVANKS